MRQSSGNVFVAAVGLAIELIGGDARTSVRVAPSDTIPAQTARRAVSGGATPAIAALGIFDILATATDQVCEDFGESWTTAE